MCLFIYRPKHYLYDVAYILVNFKVIKDGTAKECFTVIFFQRNDVYNLIAMDSSECSFCYIVMLNKRTVGLYGVLLWLDVVLFNGRFR